MVVHERALGGSSFYDEFFQENYSDLQKWALQITSYDHDLSQDLVHDAYLRFYENQTKPETYANINGYLYVVLRNSYLTHIRKRTRQRSHQLSLFDLDSIESGSLSIDPRTALKLQDELRAICEFACERKSRSIAASIAILRFFHGYYSGEVAKVVNRSRNAVEVRLAKVRQEITEYLSDESPASNVRGDALPRSAGPRLDRDFIIELRNRIFSARQGACFDAVLLRRMYRKGGSEPGRAELSHLVSCEDCLGQVNELLHLPPLSARHPLDALGPQTVIDAMHIGKARGAGSSY